MDLSKQHNLKVKGELTIHGISKNTEMIANAQLKNGNLHISSTFDVVLDNYDVDIPKIMMYKIAEVIQVVVDMKLQNKNDE